MYRIAILAYNILFPLLFLLYLPVFLSKLIRRGNYKEGFWERFGIYSPSKREQLAVLANPIWIHAVSVGEAVAALTFIREWRNRDPGARFVLSTTTSTAQAIARKHAADWLASIYFPLDFWPITQRAWRVLRPRMVVIFEVEIWPNLILMASRQGTPIALVNCRMSDRSAAGYRKHNWFFGDIFARFSVVCAQTVEDADRIRSVVGERTAIHVCNTMKYDQLPPATGAGAAASLQSWFGGQQRIVFTAASTHAGEEEIAARVFKRLASSHPNLAMILIPRHVERTAEIEATLREQDIPYNLLTDLRRRGATDGHNHIDPAISAQKNRLLVVNTTGEMMSFLVSSDIVFMGNSLAGHTGGHNIIEPAVLGKPILFGPGMDNFRVVAQQFRDADACLMVGDEEALYTAVDRLVQSAGERDQLGAAAKRLVEQNRGATAATIDLLLKEK